MMVYKTSTLSIVYVVSSLATTRPTPYNHTYTALGEQVQICLLTVVGLPGIRLPTRCNYFSWSGSLNCIEVNLRGEPEERMRGSARARGWHASPLFDLPLNNLDTLFNHLCILYLAYVDIFLEVEPSMFWVVRR